MGEGRVEGCGGNERRLRRQPGDCKLNEEARKGRDREEALLGFRPKVGGGGTYLVKGTP